MLTRRVMAGLEPQRGVGHGRVSNNIMLETYYSVHARFADKSTALKKRRITYAQLLEKLENIGVKETKPNIRNKLARGKFTAVFLVQCLEAIDSQELRLS